MTAQAAHPSHAPTLSEEDPRSADAMALSKAMNDFLLLTYPEDEENGILPTTAEEFARDGVLILARANGTPAGSGGLMAHPPVDRQEVLEVKRIIVLPEFRGLGISRLVMERLEQIARQRRVQKLVLMCGPRQPEALRLYETHGFVRRSAYGRHTEHPLSFFYEKTL